MSDGILDNGVLVWAGEETPWHGKGKQVARNMTSGEALTLAEQDWTVSLHPVYFHERELQHKDCATGQCDCGAIEPAFVMDSDHFVVVRDDIMKPLGVVGNRFVPVQNRDAFAFMDGIVGAKEAMYHTVGSIYNGKKVWMLVQLPGYIKVKDDDVAKFLLLANAHDGSMSLILKMTPIRVACANTLAAAVGSFGTSWYLRHTLSLPVKIESAREALGLASERFEKTGELYKYLGDHDMTVNETEVYLNTLFPDTNDAGEHIDGAETIRDQILNLLEGEGKGLNNPNIRLTAWAAYNAVTEYLNWKVGRKTDARLQSLWFGKMHQKINSALVGLLKVIGAPIPSDVVPVPEADLDPGLFPTTGDDYTVTGTPIVDTSEQPETKDPNVYDGDDTEE